MRNGDGGDEGAACSEEGDNGCSCTTHIECCRVRDLLGRLEFEAEVESVKSLKNFLTIDESKIEMDTC